MSIEVKNNADQTRYEAYLDGQLAGVAVYELRPSTIVFVHTEVSPDFEGKGIGGALAKGALEDVRAGGAYDVLPLCPFIKGYIEKHPEFGDLVHTGH